MKSKHAVVVLACIAVVLLLILLLWSKPMALYRVTILPSLGGGRTFPDAINDRGQIVGSTAAVGGNVHWFVWDRENGMQDLGPGGGPIDINNRGQVAGTMVDPNGERRAFVCTPGGIQRLLGTLGGHTSMAMAINSRGQVVGESWTAANTSHAFCWDEAQGMRDLNPSGAQSSYAYAINDGGQVMIFSPQLRVSLWEPNEGAHYRRSEVAGATFGNLNNRECVIVVERLPAGKSRLLISETQSDWKPLCECEGSITDIKLNDAGQALFTAMRSSRSRLLNLLLAPRLTRSYLWDPNRGVIRLERFVSRESGESLVVRDLNNRGDIVGALFSRDGTQSRGVLLEPIPQRWGGEP